MNGSQVLEELNSLFAHGRIGTLRAFSESNNIWGYDRRSQEVTLGEKIVDNNELFEGVSDALDLCGAINLVTTFSQDAQGKNVDDGDWPQYFDKHVLTQPPGMTLVPDTNFLLRHYCSNVLYRRLKNDFNKLWFLLSRFVVLEIEARANRKKLGGRGKRLAFFAVKETRFLRENAYCNMLPALSSSDIADFSRRQGTGSVDAWIRHEIHSRNTSQIVLLTCDMMNAFAAEAEGLHTCYFCKQPQESFQMKDTEQLLNFIVSTTMIFGTIKVEWIGTDGSIVNAVTYDAMWPGKTTSDWYNDRLRCQYESG